MKYYCFLFLFDRSIYLFLNVLFYLSKLLLCLIDQQHHSSSLDFLYHSTSTLTMHPSYFEIVSLHLNRQSVFIYLFLTLLKLNCMSVFIFFFHFGIKKTMHYKKLNVMKIYKLFLCLYINNLSIFLVIIFFNDFYFTNM